MSERRRQDCADPASFNELRGRIVERYPALSHQQQAIATFALAQPETMAMETAEQLARRLDVQPSALVRFAHALGYPSFRQMKQHFKAHLLFKSAGQTASSRADRDVDPANGAPASFLEAALSLAAGEIDRLRTTLDRDAFAAAVTLLDEAPTIYLTAQHQSYPMAALFAWALIRRGRLCHLLDNTGGFALPATNLADPGDLLVAISLAPYQPSVVQAANAHRGRGGKVLAITDTALAPLASAATTLLELPHPDLEPTRPLAGLTTLVQALALATTRQR
jgi:DNA-binding MurR/RpiR family transcriptional regulator